MDYLSVKEYANKYNISTRRTTLLCSEGRVVGAKKISGVWLIPSDSEKPIDKRISNIDFTKKYQETRKTILNILNFFSEKEKEFVVDSICEAIYYYVLKKYDVDVNFTNNEVSSYAVGKIIELDEKNKFVYFDLVSQVFELSNKIYGKNIYTTTQFFTEPYMIDYLYCNSPYYENGIFDPCCGGGNFITNYLRKNKNRLNSVSDVKIELEKNVGYEIDPYLAKIAVLNIKITAVILLIENGVCLQPDDLNKIIPIIYTSENNITGSLDNNRIYNCITKEEVNIDDLYLKCDAIATNPPFKTVKGMDDKLSLFLKNKYPLCNSDMCVSFLYKFYTLSKKYHKDIYMVSQNAFLYLSSFYVLRKIIFESKKIYSILDLGSGAFKNISGEKTNVSLIIMKNINEEIIYSDLKNLTYKEKKDTILDCEHKCISVKDIIKNNYSFVRQNNEFKKVGDYSIPMQGTSTGNSKKMIDFFWNHFNDSNWLPVSKGGGYCRWYGLQKYKVKWGENACFIKENKGYALRNIHKFNETKLVYSDTGTSGINVRVFEDQEVFVASGPGIITDEKYKYNLMAFLNSQIASTQMRKMCPKYTISAGYLKQLSIANEVLESKKILKLSKKCTKIKYDFYSKRPNSYNFNFNIVNLIVNRKMILDFITNELKQELIKLTCEREIEKIISMSLGIKYVNSPKSKINNILLDEFDSIWANNLNETCEIKKINTKNNLIGCDGILEYMSSIYNISFEIMFDFIINNIDKMVKTISMYNMFLQSVFVLNKFDYSSKKGFQNKKIFLEVNEQVVENLNKIFIGSDFFEYKDGKVSVK